MDPVTRMPSESEPRQATSDHTLKDSWQSKIRSLVIIRNTLKMPHNVA